MGQMVYYQYYLLRFKDHHRTHLHTARPLFLLGHRALRHRSHPDTGRHRHHFARHRTHPSCCHISLELLLEGIIGVSYHFQILGNFIRIVSFRFL